MNNNTVYEWLLQSTFTVSAREESLHSAKPYISGLIRPGDEVLDICCGTGFVSFWFESQGAKVTGMDFAPFMLSMARLDAQQRKSTIKFIEADIFKQDFGKEQYSLIICFDSISDFPASDFAKLDSKIAKALKPGGRFVVKFVDGIYAKFIENNLFLERKYQEEPELITFQIMRYLPDEGAIVTTIRNETRGEEYDRKGYIYTPPIVHLALAQALILEQHIALDAYQFLDIFIKA